MALIHCDFKSDVLKISTSAYVVIPEIQPEEKYLENSNMKFQTLYLLHGIGDDHTKWVRRTPIERYARDYKLAVVMLKLIKVSIQIWFMGISTDIYK